MKKLLGSKHGKTLKSFFCSARSILISLEKKLGVYTRIAILSVEPIREK